MNRIASFLALTFAASLTIACTQDDAVSPGDLTTTFDTVAGVIHVTNTGTRPRRVSNLSRRSGPRP